MAAKLRKYVLDSNCYIDAARNAEFRAAFDVFCARAAPGLHLSAVVAAELRAGAARKRTTLERDVLAPYVQRGRVITPSTRAWDALGTTLSALSLREGLMLSRVPRAFVFDVLIAYSCREAGATLVSANARDMARIEATFAFEWVAPFPTL